MLKVMNYLGTPGDTIKLTSSDTATALSASVITNAGRAMQGMIITVDTNPIKIAFNGVSPVQAATNVGHILAKDSAPLIIQGADLCSTMKYISSTSGNVGYMYLTPLY